MSYFSKLAIAALLVSVVVPVASVISSGGAAAQTPRVEPSASGQSKKGKNRIVTVKVPVWEYLPDHFWEVTGPKCEVTNALLLLGYPPLNPKNKISRCPGKTLAESTRLDLSLDAKFSGVFNRYEVTRGTFRVFGKDDCHSKGLAFWVIKTVHNCPGKILVLDKKERLYVRLSTGL